MEVIIADSARKHGITDQEIYQALDNVSYVVEDYDVSRVPGLPPPILYIGETDAGKKLEILAFILDDTVIFHCMILRGKTYFKALQLIQEREQQ